ncbi:MAG: ArsR/SmtB family transcription factor [Chloroflexota bacterium]
MTEVADVVRLSSDVAADEASRLERYRLHAEICKVLTDPKRLMLIDALRAGEQSVGELADLIGLSLANASQHLAVLRHAGLVDTRRAGTSIRYRLSDSDLVAACDIIDRIARRRLDPPTRER